MPIDARRLLTNSLLLGLFVCASLFFAVYMVQNNGESSLRDDPFINQSLNNLEGNLSQTQSGSQDQLSNFENDTPTIGTDSFLFSSVIGSAKNFRSTTTAIFNIAIDLISRSLGLNNSSGLIIFTTIITVFIIAIIFSFWSLYKTGR